MKNTKKTKSKDTKSKTKLPSTSTPPLDPLALVRAATPHCDPTAPPSVTITEHRFFAVVTTPIPGVSVDELTAILEREGVAAEYPAWRDAKAAAMSLSVVGGIESAIVVSDLTKRRITRGEMWVNGRCVSLDGGVTKPRRDD